MRAAGLVGRLLDVALRGDVLDDGDGEFAAQRHRHASPDHGTLLVAIALVDCVARSCRREQFLKKIGVIIVGEIALIDPRQLFLRASEERAEGRIGDDDAPPRIENDDPHSGAIDDGGEEIFVWPELVAHRPIIRYSASPRPPRERGGLGLPTIPSNLTVAAVGDFNGDGGYDLLWHNNSTGANSIWFINNGFNGGMELPAITGNTVQIMAPK